MMLTPPSPPPAEPCNFSGGLESRALNAGLSFLELTASPSLDLRSMSLWFDEHVVQAGCMARPTMLVEPQTCSVVLHPDRVSLASARANLPRLASAARARVLTALQGFVATPSDDRFLRAAVYLGRTRREGGRWVARPQPTTALSDVVLSLFAVTMLSNRDIYDAAFCLCDTCWSIFFDGREEMRHNCVEHAARSSFVPYMTTFPSSEPTYVWR